MRPFGPAPAPVRLADGRPHPHAGTGFGLLVVLGFPPDHSELKAAGRRNKYTRLELQQYRYDGTTFTVISTEKIGTDALLPGWTVTNGGRLEISDIPMLFTGSIGRSFCSTTQKTHIR